MYCEEAPASWGCGVSRSIIAVKEIWLRETFVGEPRELRILRLASSKSFSIGGEPSRSAHIVKLLGSWRVPRGRLFIAMESFGKSLRQLMRSGQVVKMDRRNILRGIMTGLHHLSTRNHPPGYQTLEHTGRSTNEPRKICDFVVQFWLLQQQTEKTLLSSVAHRALLSCSSPRPITAVATQMCGVLAAFSLSCSRNDTFYSRLCRKLTYFSD